MEENRQALTERGANDLKILLDLLACCNYHAYTLISSKLFNESLLNVSCQVRMAERFIYQLTIHPAIVQRTVFRAKGTWTVIVNLLLHPHHTS